MHSASKPFGAKAISSFSQRFELSLFKLTLLYTGLLAIILLLSSSVSYSYFSNRLDDRYRDFRPHMQEYIIRVLPVPPSQEDVQHDLVYSLVLVNGILLIVAGAASYVLALVTLEPLKIAYERQRRFLGDASHELRTPLSVLRLDIENELADSRSSEKTRERAASNLEEVERMSRLVDDLLILSRLDEDGLPAHDRTEVNINETVQKIVAHLQPLASKHNVTIYEPTHASIVVHTNEELLSRALTNVIKNAILYNKREGTITISFKATLRTATIIVTDTGTGIAPEDAAKIFDRFYRVDKSRSRQTGGSGLGLSIVKSSLERLGGSIELASEVDKGTTVTITLPIK